MIKQRAWRTWLLDCGALVIGSVLFAMGVNMFLLPGEIVFGGFTGIATLAHRLWGLPTGLVIGGLNLPLLVWCGVQNGVGRVWRTLLAILVTSTATDLLTFFPTDITDPLLCALFGGLAIGSGVGLLLRRGYNTGGTDLIATMIGRYVPLSTGMLILAMDVAVIGVSALMLGDIEAAFYAVISGFACARLLDFFLFGAGRAKQAIIFTEAAEPLAKRLMADLHRGVTILSGVGGYTGAPRPVLLCVVRPSQAARVRAIVGQVDPHAFLLFGEVSEVRGEGWRNLSEL